MVIVFTPTDGRVGKSQTLEIRGLLQIGSFKRGQAAQSDRQIHDILTSLLSKGVSL